ncbi:hypothetical protein F5887DRAFT_897667 [Amanita rubescens]|nr:hypothetical protein F5887DRAFT_897667 [Amanita rubescens]
MTLPIAIPSTPSLSNSPSSEEYNLPHTPDSPTMSQLENSAQQAVEQPLSKSPSPSQPPQQQQSNSNSNSAAPGTANAQPKRKPSRRANTAERRATHNAVERQRRETLNSRFLDLAALLPNLSQIRRPSKSSIVNSSIAHINASRRHRIHASRELRSLKNEADQLRRELNNWHDRAGIPRIEEPIRSEAFSMVISGELEVIATVTGEEEDDEMYGGYDGDEDYGPVPHAPMPHSRLDDLEDPRVAMLKASNSFHHGMPAQHPHHSSGNALHLAHVMPRSAAQAGGPMIASPTTISFDNPAMPSMFDSPAYPGVPFIPAQSHSPHTHQSLESEKIAAWNAAQIFHSGQMAQQPRAMFTPPASHPISAGSPSHSSHGSPHGSVSPPHSTGSPVSSHSGLAFNEAELYRAHDEREQTTLTPAISSVRNRSGSLNINMTTGSPGGSPTYDITNPGEYTLSIPRRAMHSGIWARDNDIGMGALNVSMNMGMNPVAVGGGNGTGFAMMM